MATRYPDESAVRQLITRTKEELDNRLAYSSNTNLINNWYFGDPVNQLGKTEYTDTTGNSSLHTIDKWTAVRATMKVDDGCIKVNTSKSTAATGWIGYKLVPEELGLVGKTCVYSILFDNELYSFKFTYPARGQKSVTLQFSLNNVQCIMQIEYVEDKNFSSVQLFINKSDIEFSIVAVKLELGDRQTLARKIDGKWVLIDPIPDKGERLMICKRYYQQYGIGLTGLVQNGKVRFTIPFSVTMRATPSVSLLKKSIKFNSDKDYTLNSASIESKIVTADGCQYIVLSGTFADSTPANGTVLYYNESDPLFAFDADYS